MEEKTSVIPNTENNMFLAIDFLGTFFSLLK